MSSAYGSGSPTYVDADLQLSNIEGRLVVAIGIRDRSRASGDARRAGRWAQIVDELLDRRLEVRGR